MACIDCLDNCEEITSDKCVRYTGANIECLGICTGDTLYEVEVAILEKFCSILDGTGIDLSDLTVGCTFLTDLLGSEDKTLANLIQMLIDGECSLRELIQDLDDEINTPYSFNTSCLSGLGTTPTRDEVLNAALIKLCSVDARVTAIENDYVKNSELCAKVTVCLASTATQEYTKMAKYVAMPYHGPMTVFDTAGKGLSAFGYDKVYICNGQTVGTFTTPDYRGRTPIGANINIPGSIPLDTNVDPALAPNTGYGINVGLKKGNYTHTLSVSESPAHTHSVNDSGHFHLEFGYPEGGSIGANNSPTSLHNSGNLGYSIQGATTDAILGKTNTVQTGITIGSSGNSTGHNNVQPSLGTCFVMYIPT